MTILTELTEAQVPPLTNADSTIKGDDKMSVSLRQPADGRSKPKDDHSEEADADEEGSYV